MTLLEVEGITLVFLGAGGAGARPLSQAHAWLRHTFNCTFLKLGNDNFLLFDSAPAFPRPFENGLLGDCMPSSPVMTSALRNETETKQFQKNVSKRFCFSQNSRETF